MNKDMAAFFDELAPKWDNAPAEYGTREKLTSMMGLPRGGVIADIGCGKGVMIEHLLKTNPMKIIAVDVSSEMIRSAKNLFDDRRVYFFNDDFFDVSFPMLDAAIFFNSYPHFTDKAALIEKLANIIKKDGILIIAHSLSRAEINGTHTGESVSKLSVPLDSAEAEARKYEMYFSPDTLVDNDEIYFVKMTRR